MNRFDINHSKKQYKASWMAAINSKPMIPLKAPFDVYWKNVGEGNFIVGYSTPVGALYPER